MPIELHKKLDDYVRLFEINNMPFFVNDTLLQNYKNLNTLIIYQHEVWTCFIPKTMVEATSQDGLELYSSTEKFEQYKRDFDEYKKQSVQLFSSLVKKEELDTADIDNFLNEITQLHRFYLRTEFFYTDEAFRQSASNETAKHNLKSLDYVKNSGREHLNKVFFGNESWIRQFFLVLSKQHHIKETDLWQYTQQEIGSIPKSKPSKDTLKERQGSYFVRATANNVTFTFGSEADGLVNHFLSAEEAKQEIKGIVANKGVVKGTVKIITYGYNDFDTLHQKIAAMNEGDVLVAETTSPELVVACHKAAAIITNQGGLLSHAAIISRELGIPCIVGTGDATELLRDGEIVEVDANLGTVRKIS